MTEYTFTKGGTTITVDLGVFDERALADRVVSPEAWLADWAGAAFDKIDSAKEAIAAPAIVSAVRAGAIKSLPNTRDEIVDGSLSAPGYKNRAAREAAVR